MPAGTLPAPPISHSNPPAHDAPAAPLGLHALADVDTIVHPEGEMLAPSSVTLKIASVAVIVLPFVGLLAAIVLLWGAAFSWMYLALLLVGYSVTGLGITVGYHRLFTHRSFETHPLIKAFFAITGSMAAEGPVLGWVAAHRKHHQHSDREGDPHSPHHHGDTFFELLRGFVHAHFGWFVSSGMADVKRYAPDLAADTLTRRISKLFPLWVVLGLAVPALIAFAITGTWTGALLGLLWGGAVRLFLVHHVTWSINSVCHLWGRQTFRSRDHSRNNILFGILGFGEGWHNNHHAFPTSARHGLSWWQLDVSYLVIKALALVGLATNIRVPTSERIASGRIRRR